MWRENVAFIIARCTNECSQLIPLRLLETILSHVGILFGAICSGKSGQNLLFITQYYCRAVWDQRSHCYEMRIQLP